MQEALLGWINKEQYEEIIQGISNCPHKLLGLHDIGDGQGVLAFRPFAKKIEIVNKEEGLREELEPLDECGMFGKYFEDKNICFYEYEITYGENDVVTTADPYNFESQIGELDRYLFGEGTHTEIYTKLGAHPMVLDGVQGTYFAVWAPHARSISVVGDFNSWDSKLHPMRMLEESGIYELFIPGVKAGAIYKYYITTREGNGLFKCDPYANAAEVRPSNASVVADLTGFRWNDRSWMQRKARTSREDLFRKPMSIYEVHPGSWRKHDDGTEDGFYNYKELAHELGDYLLEMNYTHVELMGISEYPFDGSWGYQVVGYYAPTSRYGSPQDFMYFVDYMHQKGISVILDWVPAHFPKDEHGLARFDGEALYEHPDSRRGEHPHWGTYIFNYGKKEVENFLVANALFWVNKYHIDGLRVDAVASMLYLDYGKNDGEWLPNEHGGRENIEAINVMQHLNRIIEEQYPSTLIIAEESTAWSGVTAPVSMKGLGFTLKWNMGWMNDFLEYMKLDPYFRQFNHNKLTFSLMYARSENFIQVLSHDEVVHGKGSMINKMPGDDAQKFANLRVAYGFMYGHPGKKLLFMGQEFAQYREWSEARSLDWYLLGEERNKQMQQYVKELNRLYKTYSAFYYNDFDEMGFEWMDCNNAQMSVVSFIRRGKAAKNQLLFICNFTPVERKEFVVGVPCSGAYKELLNSDAVQFGGSGMINKEPIQAVKEEYNGRDYRITVDLPPLSVLAFCYDYKKREEKNNKNSKDSIDKK